MPNSSDFSWKNARILVADDEPDMRDVFASWLRNVGCSVTEVCDGQEALDELSKSRFDAVVTDVRMPRVDGIQLAYFLHDSSEYTPVVIFVSGYVDLALPDAYNLGVEAVLAKPCERKELIEALKRSIQRRHLVFEPEESVLSPAPESAIRQDFAAGPEVSSVAIGRGGLSLKSSEFLSAGSAVAFSLTFAEGLLPALTGWGLVRWCEVISKESRVGIEFMYLDPQSREFFARWIQVARPASFIPKEPVVQSAAKASG